MNLSERISRGLTIYTLKQPDINVSETYNMCGEFTTENLKQLILGAALSQGLALLIIHPGMFASAHAFPTPPDYQFEEPDSIAPDLEGEDYGLNPFYAGRPLYDEDMVYPMWVWATLKFL